MRNSTARWSLDCAELEPQITWGTDPSQVVGDQRPRAGPRERRAGAGGGVRAVPSTTWA